MYGRFANYSWNSSVQTTHDSTFTIRTILVDLLDDLPEGGGLDLHAHHREDAAHVVSGDGAVLVSEAVKASLEHLDLVGLEADVRHLLLGQVLLNVRHDDDSPVSWSDLLASRVTGT